MAIDLGPDGLTLGSTTINDWADVGGGKVLQVIQAEDTSQFSTTSSSMVDAGLSASITPASTSNKVLVILDGQGGQDTSGRSAKYRILRGTTQIAFKDNLQTGTSYSSMPMTIVELDSPSTTSATTYKVQVSTDAVGTMFLSNGSNSRLILIELEF